MKNYVLIIGLLLSNYALGVELRGIELAESCQSASSKENKQGSVPLSGGADKTIAFNGVHEGREATIIYRCHDGIVVDQIITITVHSKNHAIDLFNFIKERLKSELALPGLSINEIENMARKRGMDTENSEDNQHHWYLKGHSIMLRTYLIMKTEHKVSLSQRLETMR